MRKNIKRIIILILILFISIGFAVLTSNLSINSTFNFKKNCLILIKICAILVLVKQVRKMEYIGLSESLWLGVNKL